tara:strand:+ start:381 stop:1445 length:1065 start_codon:yes stop_codon:yes gene_type:complete
MNSYSPSINKDLHLGYHSKSKSYLSLEKNKKFNIKSLNKILLLPKFKIRNKTKKNLKLTDKDIKKKLIKNLSSKKTHSCNNIMAPKQILSNCWFNVLFMTFFVSDKGIKYFKHLRLQMIKGKKLDGTLIKPQKLRDSLMLLNYFIDISTSEIEKNKILAEKLNTNSLILNIYNSIPKSDKKKFVNIKKLNDSGNPIYYYMSLISYLKPNTFDFLFLELNFNNYLRIQNINKINFTDINKIPNIIIFQIPKPISKTFIKKMDYSISFDNKKYKYILDSICIIDNENQHFGSLLTCNKEYYGFDGASYKRLNKFNWSKLINSDKKWTFKGSKWQGTNENIYWNFKDGYQLLFYYRI